MKIVNYLFYRLYKNSSITNKSVPEWASISVISITMTFNIVCLLILFEYDIKSIGKKYFELLPIILIGIGYFIFLYKKRYIKIIEHFDQIKIKPIYDILVFLYICASILFFFYLADFGIKYWIFVIILLLVLSQIPNLIKLIKK